jgi:hypothetical protein
MGRSTINMGLHGKLVAALVRDEANRFQAAQQSPPSPLKIGDVVPLPPIKRDVRPTRTSDNRPSFKPARNGKR